MIWLVLLIMALSTGLYICAPLYAKDEPEIIGEDIQAYKAELGASQSTSEKPDIQSFDMQRQLLKRVKLKPLKTGVPKFWLGAVFLGTLIGTGGLYSALGEAGFMHLGAEQAALSDEAAQREALAAGLTPQERSEMITAMVEGLAARLRENPDDIDGWTRLLRSRLVLGQSDVVMEDMKLIRETYKDRPEVIGEILVKSGWAKMLDLQPVDPVAEPPSQADD